MDISSLMAISPLDGRYHEKMTVLREIFSEYGLIKYRVMVEIRWLELLSNCHLPDIPKLSSAAKTILDKMIENFSPIDALQIKKIETSINHDVKAIEYFIKQSIQEHDELKNISEFIHFGCTSEDINNLAYGMMLQDARTQCILPSLNDLISLLKSYAQNYASIAMLARTHGQPASPTTLGKEIANVIARLQRQLDQLAHTPILGKINGASGNYNALAIAYPNIDWQQQSQKFISILNLNWNPYTTQIEPHDSIAELFAIMLRINTILIGFNRDLWGYIALNYFNQKLLENEVGSSTMPHKINPIDFENSEGNLGIANALFEHMMAKLPISRWQRDLSDSTVLRNMGVAIGHSLLAYQATLKGLKKVEPNQMAIEADLNQHWEVLGEAIQTMMRRFKLEQPYEKLKAFTRGKVIDQSIIQEFIRQLPLPDIEKNQLLALTPHQYIGYAEKLAKKV
ncbi:MAG: adenylosuccinate lyase [Gammaproteobacteria bacterium RIFCSPHIGHO2_12_FULL_37_14]|nr:MAG: adenylosuccinate lyase [Gammaproteobacteria bacterium RIFCSPHIGHO2_12_FULL_37_14]